MGNEPLSPKPNAERQPTRQAVSATSRHYGFLLDDIEGFDSLVELALDLRWSWNHAADELWHGLDPALWESTHNPWLILQTVSLDRLKAVLLDPQFTSTLEALLQERSDALAASSWFREGFPQARLTTVAYFSMEFMFERSAADLFWRAR